LEKKMPVSAEFRKGLSKNTAAKKRFTKAKEARPGSGFDAPDVPKGQYICQVTAEAYKNGRGNLEVALKYKIMKGEFANTQWKRRYELEGDEERAEFIDKDWEALSKSIQVLADIGEEELEDFQNWSTDDLCDILDKIEEEAPIVKAGISPWESKSGTRNLNFFINSIVEDVEAEELDVDPDDVGEEEEAEEEAEEEEEKKPTARSSRNGKKSTAKPTATRSTRKKQEEEEAEEEEEEEEAEQEEGEEEAPEILKGNFVFYKPKGSRKTVECEVVSSNRAKEECTLKSVDDPTKKYTAVAWDAVELIEEE
jgi:hypothetical protein